MQLSFAERKSENKIKIEMRGSKSKDEIKFREKMWEKWKQKNEERGFFYLYSLHKYCRLSNIVSTAVEENLIDFNVTSTYPGLFYAKRFENSVDCTFIFTFLV